MAAYFIGMQIRMRREATRSDRSNPASNDVNLPGLATTETLTRHGCRPLQSIVLSCEQVSGTLQPSEFVGEFVQADGWGAPACHAGGRGFESRRSRQFRNHSEGTLFGSCRSSLRDTKGPARNGRNLVAPGVPPASRAQQVNHLASSSHFHGCESLRMQQERKTNQRLCFAPSLKLRNFSGKQPGHKTGKSYFLQFTLHPLLHLLHRNVRRGKTSAFVAVRAVHGVL